MKSTLNPDGDTKDPEEGLAMGAPRLKLSGRAKRRELCSRMRAKAMAMRPRQRSSLSIPIIADLQFTEIEQGRREGGYLIQQLRTLGLSKWIDG